MQTKSSDAHRHDIPERRAGATSDREELRANRRIVLRAAAGVAALAASGIGARGSRIRPAVAQEAGGTRATRFVPESEGFSAADAAAGEWVTFQADYPFWALGASWSGDVGTWPVIQIQLSDDGASWSESVSMTAQTEDGGQPSRDDRVFTPLVFTSGESFVRFQTIDGDGVPGEVAGLSFVYIDPTDGPWEDDLASGVGGPGAITTLQLNDTLAPPEIITRSQWGANEDWRFADFGEVWPPEYETVSHIVIHHTATSNRPVDVPGAIRSIYYYHAVEQAWGDIGYNYLVDHNGRIYQGRYGGQDVIGGHSFQFAVGSSGISVIGNFMSTSLPEASKSALVSIAAWVGRDLDPMASSDFHEAPNLPTITSHRDVNQTTCPGDMLWNEIPSIRQLVAQTLEEGVLETGAPAGIAPGDRVRVQTDDGSSLNIRSTANGTVVGSIANGELAWVTDGPTTTSNANWYQIDPIGSGPTGWSTAAYLIVDPPPFPGDGTGYPFGLNLRFVSTANLRRGPGTGTAVIASVPEGTLAHVMMGPLQGSGLSWYQVRAYNIADGWVASGLIEPVPFNSSPNAAFAVGDFVEATQSLNVRARPGIAQGITAVAPTGTRFEITVAPVQVNDYIWYGAYSSAHGGGWIVEDSLRASTPPPTGKFDIGDAVRVTERMNLRATPSTSASVVASMPAGTTASVLDGPRSANGYVWWRIRTSAGTTGWAAENWLVETTTTPPPTGRFEVGDAIRVTERLNLRTSASTSGSVVVVLQPGVTGTVLAGPNSGSGYTWYRIQT
ncbi:MAG TPA: SH3 domain-containing protein, partial [Thermomicrobiales bacterium]|nr:SH3 domain-containing protein [Thermomicrobiales bacterium]